ncbi:MAG TPA: glycolate oxidase subunit GlcE [Steroidobacteraceae bacterium]
MADCDLTLTLADRVRIATSQGAALRLVGSDTKRFYGRPVDADVLELRGHTGIVNYDPAELVLTARCGTMLAEIEALLASNGQRLAFDPPQYGAAGTIGGAIAAGLAGPGRVRFGSARDYVLGVRMLAGDGRVLRFGGEVMKNVAGYDVSRLLAGSLGILGVLLEISIKVLPRAPTELTLAFDRDQSAALQTLTQWSGTALPVSAGAWVDGRLHVRFEGSEATLASVANRLGGERVEPAPAFWTGLRDQTHAFFARTGRLWRLQLPLGVAPLPVGMTLVEWQGMQRWCYEEDGIDLHAVAAAAGGSASLFRGAVGSEEVFAPLAPPVLELHRSLKQVFDPAGILNPGRMYAGL